MALGGGVRLRDGERQDKWGWAIGMGAMALVSYLIAPAEVAAAYGLDHEFAVDDDEFLPTMAGATGVPLSAGQPTRHSQQRRRVLSGDARGDQAGEALDHDRGLHLLGGRDRAASSPKRSPAQGDGGLKVKILLDAVGSSTIGDDILTILEAGGCQLAWYNPIRWYSLGRFNHRTHRKSLDRRRPGRRLPAAPASPITGAATRGIPDHWRDMQIRLEGPAVMPLQTGFAQNWLQTTGELISGPLYYPRMPSRPGRSRIQTIMSSPETGASSVRTMYYLSIICARRVDLHRESVFRARRGGASTR